MKAVTRTVDDKTIKEILIRENKFINDLFSLLPAPSHLQSGGMYFLSS